MKNIFFAFFLISSGIFAQEGATVLNEKISKAVVEAGCGKCCFKTKGMKKCHLAVRIEGKVYPVEGKTLKDFGPPKLKHGLCRDMRKAEVSGEIINNHFLAYDFKLLPFEKSEMPLIQEGEAPPIENKM